jgi:RNA polymerase sigma-54 factor
MTKSLLSLHQNPSLDLRPKLMMTEHMQQALRLLQIPIQELDLFLEEQVINNPLLEIEETPGEIEVDLKDKELFDKEIEISENDFSILKQMGEEWQENFESEEKMPIRRSSEEDKLKTFMESSICAEPSLQDHLKQEIQDVFETPEERNAATILIGYIDQSGFLTTPITEISSFHQLDAPVLTRILKTIQSLEPHGLGAATIQESLLIQLRCQLKQDSLAYRIIRDHYDDLLHNRLKPIQQQLHASFEEIQECIEKTISKLDLHPGANFSSIKGGIIIPDLSIVQEGDTLTVEVNRDHYHKLHFNYKYLKLLDNPDIPLETKTFVRHHILSAKWLIRNLQQRYSTLERIALLLIEKQRAFLSSLEGQLSPLTMGEVADELQLHESTIGRTVSNKYINTPRGLILLRSFFTGAYTSNKGEILSSKTIQEAISALIKEEDKKNPLSDDLISTKLKEQGFVCARRTVTKHRYSLGIGSASQRKRY